MPLMFPQFPRDSIATYRPILERGCEHTEEGRNAKGTYGNSREVTVAEEVTAILRGVKASDEQSYRHIYRHKAAASGRRALCSGTKR